MGNITLIEGNSVDSPSSTELKDKLVRSLTSFVDLYDRHEERLQRAPASFAQTAARLREMQKSVFLDKTVLCVFGGALGAFSGGITGVLVGPFGAVAATSLSILAEDINVVGATFGFAGSLIGGMAGGAFSGCVGGAVSAANAEVSSSFCSVGIDAVSLTLGFATGGTIGGLFGGSVGAAGGAVGGLFGAWIGARSALNVVGKLSNFGAQDPKEETNKKEASVVQQTGHDFSETIKPLVVELNIIRTITDTVTSGADVRRAAGQTAETLAAVTAMEKTVRDYQRATDLRRFVSSVDEAARRSGRICEQMKKTRTEAEKLLVSLRKC